MAFHFFSRTPKPKIHFVLDIGTESVKALILEIKKEKTSVLGSSLEYYDQFSIFLTNQFEREVLERTISKVVSEIERETNLKSNSVILGLPPNIFVSRVILQHYKRKGEGIIKEEEKEALLKDVLERAKKEIAEIYAKEKEILPDDLQFSNLKILEIRIDGYIVPDILNYDGKDLDFRILVSFLPKYYLGASFSGFFSPLPVIKDLGFEILGITQTSEGLTLFLDQNPETVFLDIGGEVTQIFLVKNGLFEKISEFNKGGKDFSRILSERLGLDEPSARDLKHRYAEKDIGEESRQRIRQFFEEISQNWFKNLKEKLREMSCGIFPSDILIFGGGALLPEIKELLEYGDWEDISFAEPPKVKLLKPKDLINIEEKIGLTAQNTPSLLIYPVRKDGLSNGAYYAEKVF